MKGPHYNDFRDGRPVELMKTYKMNVRQLENALRNVNDGATPKQLEKEYDKFYRRNRKDA